jgi:hypothetical protein
VIFLVVLFSIGAFMQADAESRNILGDHGHQIFSYVRTDNGTAEFTAFGESLTLDLNKISAVKQRFGEISAANREYTPALITLSRNIITLCLTSITDSVKQIPGIIRHFSGRGGSAEPEENDVILRQNKKSTSPVSMAYTPR